MIYADIETTKKNKIISISTLNLYGYSVFDTSINNTIYMSCIYYLIIEGEYRHKSVILKSCLDG